MTIPVSDPRSNPDDQFAYAAKVIGRSIDRAKVFKAICSGSSPVKTVEVIHKKTGLSRMRVLQEGRYLVNKHIVTQTKRDGDTAYQKDPFYCSQHKKILSTASSPNRLARLPTKTSPLLRINSVIATILIPRNFIRTKYITIDDIDSFSRVRKIRESDEKTAKIPEAKFKAGIQRIIGEKGKFSDWGGEKNDLLTTRLRLNRKRRVAAFAFKGPGKSGKLTPKMMGKNGDQIQRLFESASDVYVVQYWSQIDENVIKLMAELAKAKSVSEGREIFYCVIDGQDSSRIINAYPKMFNSKLVN